MILHPGILALVLGASFVFLMTLFSAAIGGIIVLRWDFNSSSSYQLSLERRTYLISTIMNYVLGFQAVSLFLFLYVVDDLYKLFVGAMCATGSLNANPIGWYALISKIAAFFCAGFWLALNSIDQRAEDYPLVRLKYILLLCITPLMGLDLFLQAHNLSPFLSQHAKTVVRIIFSCFLEWSAEWVDRGHQWDQYN